MNILQGGLSILSPAYGLYKNGFFSDGPKTTQDNSPWAGQQPYLTDVFSRAQNLFNTGGSMYPGFSAPTVSAMNMIQQRAQSGNPLIGQAQQNLGSLFGNYNPAQSLLSNFVGGNPSSNALEAIANGSMAGQNPVLDMTARRLGEAYSRNVLPQVMSQFELAGRTGSSAEREAMLNRLGDLKNTLGDVAAQSYQADQGNRLAAAQALGNQQLSGIGMLGDIYNRGLASQLQAIGMAPQLTAGDYTDALMLGQVGAQQDQLAQQQAQEPWQKLQAYQQAVMGNYGGTSTSQTTVNPLQGMMNFGAQLAPWALLAGM